MRVAFFLMSAHKATPDPQPHKEFNLTMQANLKAYSFANNMAQEKALELLIRFGVASCIATPD
jgi:hypothetical protein